MQTLLGHKPVTVNPPVKVAYRHSYPTGNSHGNDDAYASLDVCLPNLLETTLALTIFVVADHLWHGQWHNRNEQ